MTEAQHDMEQRRSARDKYMKPERGSYADDRMRQLKKERAKYNVNDLGYYSGGLPQKDKGTIRGKSLGIPHYFHDPDLHNRLNYMHPDSHFVTSEDALKFKWWMQSDIVDLTKTEPYYPMYYDKNFIFLKDRSFWLTLLVFMTGFTYFKKRYNVESNRFMRFERNDLLQNKPAHHYVNRGGVLLKKQFVGFEKEFKNDQAEVEWHQRVYPEAYKQ